MRRRIKSFLGWLLLKTRLYRLLLGASGVVVTFHSISDRDRIDSRLCCSADEFERYCRMFRQYFNVVPLTEILDDLEAGRPVRGKLAITFDDGYRDNLVRAAPILKKHGLPATVFLCTKFIGSEGAAWWDKDAGVASEWMTWDEVNALTEFGIEIGAHTQSHVDLTQCTLETAAEEIVGSRDLIESRTGIRPAVFAYPYGGAHQINDQVRSIVAESGFRCCASSYGGLVAPGDDPRHLERWPINQHWFVSPGHFLFELMQWKLSRQRPVDGEYPPTGSVGAGNKAQPPATGTHRPRVLLVSFHFRPDPAVGARRPTELARTLVQSGHEVTVLRASTNPGVASADATGIPKLGEMPVRVPPKLTPLVMSRITGLRLALDKPVSDTDSSQESNALGGAGESCVEPGEDHSESIVHRLKRYYHSLEWALDDHKLWTLKAMFKLLWERRRGRFDLVLVSGPPMSPNLAGLIASWLNACPLILDLRDPWMNNPWWPAYVRSGFSRWLERTCERICVGRASAVVTAAPGLGRQLRSRYPEKKGHIHLVYNGYDDVRRSPPTGEVGRLSLLYAGALYYNRNPFPLLRALDNLVSSGVMDPDRVRIKLVGKCDAWQGRRIREWAQSRAIDDVLEVLPPVLPEQVPDLMESATVLINFAQNQDDQIPAKTFEYLASGRESLLLADVDSDSAEIVRQTESGVVVDGESTEEIEQALEDLYKKYAIEGRRYSPREDRIAEYSRASQNRKYMDIIIRVLGGRA